VPSVADRLVQAVGRYTAPPLPAVGAALAFPHVSAASPRGVASNPVSDEQVAGRIERLVAEEQELRDREQSDRADSSALDSDRERLETVKVELDRCWDLLRQRRALTDAGADPDEAQARDAETVEHYRQ
jgi:uncharacterized protein DUF2630